MGLGLRVRIRNRVRNRVRVRVRVRVGGRNPIPYLELMLRQRSIASGY